jgi:hypothetical protein
MNLIPAQYVAARKLLGWSLEVLVEKVKLISRDSRVASRA